MFFKLWHILFRKMYTSFILFVVAISMTEAVNRNKLVQTPSTQTDLNLDEYLGFWYAQAFYTPCSWNGAKDFTDYITYYEYDQNDELTIEITWRALRCVTTINDYLPDVERGMFLLNDTMGDLITSESHIVATDYHGYVVKWGCTRRLANGFCHDPYVIVKTRSLRPSNATMDTVKDILYDKFELKLEEMTIYGNEAPCPRPQTASLDNGPVNNNPTSIPFRPLGTFGQIVPRDNGFDNSSP